MNFLVLANCKRLVLSFCVLSALLLTACEQGLKINENVNESERNAERLIDTISPDGQIDSVLQIDDRPWFGSQAVPIQSNKNLPSYLMQDDAIVLTFNGAVSLSEVAKMIEATSGIRVVVSNNIHGSSMGNLGTNQFTPIGGDEVPGGRIIWSGSLGTLLDQISSTYGSEWSYDGQTITITSELTKTFMLHALASTMTLTGNASSTDGSGSNVPEISVDGTTTLEIWGEVSEAVERIIGDQGQASFSPSTGTITITARPNVLERVESYLRYQNQMRMRRVSVSVQVLSVTTSDTENYTVDISGAINDALGRSVSTSATSGASGINLSVFKGANSAGGSFTSSLQASEGIQRVDVVHSGSLVTLSDQPAPLQVARQVAYLERVSSSGADTGSISLEPGTVDLGLFMTVLPRIVQNDNILMRLSIALTDAETPFRSFGTSGNDAVAIELPEVSTTGFLQNAVLGDGETLVLAGFERRENNLRDTRSPGGFLFGGTRGTNRARELLVLVINAQILPEQPITVIGQ
jgi:type IVB pilus formation R64 PilN family outer membrane protein